MNKNTIIKAIAIVIGIIVILSILLILNIQDDPDRPIEEDGFGDNDSTMPITDAMNSVMNETMFYTVENCIQKYLNICSYNLDNQVKLQDNIEIKTEEEKKQVLYNLLSNKYINDNNIVLDNIENYIHYNLQNPYFMAKKMNVLNYETMDVYSVYGKLRLEQEDIKIIDQYFIVYLDENNMIFSIEPIEANKYTDINQIDIKDRKISLTPNMSNTFTYRRIKEKDIPSKYMNAYKDDILYDMENAFESLDEKYRELRFGNIENYKKYVEENKTRIIGTTITEYEATEKDDYKQYVCKDQYGAYYVFKENATMQYSLMLDTYTINLPEFTEKYNSGNEQLKVAMNIEKITEAINAKDYTYLYSKLPEGFKQNYFETEESFKQFIQRNFPEYNKVTYIDFKNEGKNYLYTVKFSDKTEKTNARTERTIIMQLKENNDFVFSLGTEEHELDITPIIEYIGE